MSESEFQQIVGQMKRFNSTLRTSAYDDKRVEQISSVIDDCLVRLESLNVKEEEKDLVDLGSDECDFSNRPSQAMKQTDDSEC